MWENENAVGTGAAGRVFPQLFRVLPCKLSEVFLQLDRNTKNIFVFLLENTAQKENNFSLIIKM